MKNKFTLVFLVLCGIIVYLSLSSSSGGISGTSSSGCSCHNATASASTIVSISGLPANGYVAGQVYNLTITVTNTSIVGAPIAGAGYDLTCNIGILDTVGGTGSRKFSNLEIGHSARKNFVSGSTSWSFKWTAPSTGNTSLVLNYAGNAVNGNGNTLGDFWNTGSVTVPKALAIALSSSPILCNGNTSNITVTASGGTSPYSYKLNAGSFGSSNILGPVVAGVYTITTSDALSNTVSQTINITQPTSITLSSSNAPILCNGGTTTLIVNASGGTPNYTYSSDNITYSTNNSFTKNAGTYTVYAKDANNCSKSTTISITQPATMSATISSVNHVTCFGLNNGNATVSVQNGINPLTFSWAPSGGAAPTANNLTAGTYTVTVSSATNCVASTTITVTQPPLLVMHIDSVKNKVCDNTFTGYMGYTVTGGTGAYSYVLNPSLGINNSTTTFWANLKDSTYVITVTDANLCTSSASFVINAYNPTTVLTNVTPLPAYSGDTVLFTIVSPTLANSFAWSNGAITSNTNTLKLNSVLSSNSSTYTATVVDTNGCTAASTVNFTVNSVATLHAKVYLSGAYNAANNLMYDSLRVNGKLDSFAKSDPYSNVTYLPFFTHINNTIVDTIRNTLFAVSDSNAIVDWVFLELRSSVDSSVVVATKSALVTRCGKIIDARTGAGLIRFLNSLPNNYFISVRHRNHLGVMTKSKINLGELPVLIDFTSLSTPLYRKSPLSNNFIYTATQDSCTRILNGRRALYAGNASTITGLSNIQVKYNGASNDRLSIFALSGSNGILTGYLKQDLNLDGKLKYNGAGNDRLLILQNVGTNSSNIVEEQLPN